MRTIVLSNEKGGVGKTTLTEHLAKADAAMGARVVLIDADPQGHSTTRCGHPKKPSIYRLLMDDEGWDEHLHPVNPALFAMDGVAHGELWVLPSNKNTLHLGGLPYTPILAERLEELKGWADYVYIDTSPTASLFHGVLFFAADEVIYPTQLAYGSFDGLVESFSAKRGADKERKSQYAMKGIEVAGIVPTMTRLNTLEHQTNFESLKAQFGRKVMPAISESVVWEEAERVKEAVWVYAPNHSATAQFWDVYQALFGARVTEKEVAHGA